MELLVLAAQISPLALSDGIQNLVVKQVNIDGLILFLLALQLAIHYSVLHLNS